MSDYLTDLKNKDNKISILQNLVEKNDGHVTRLKNMIDQLKKQLTSKKNEEKEKKARTNKDGMTIVLMYNDYLTQQQLKFEQEKNTEMSKDMNKLRETIQTQNLKVRELQESLFKSKETERQLHIKLKDFSSTSPIKQNKGSSTTKSMQGPSSTQQQNSHSISRTNGQVTETKSMHDITKFEENDEKETSSSPKLKSHELLMNAQNEEASQQSSDRKRRHQNLKVDSQVGRNQSYVDSPKLQRTMLSVVEEDLSNIMKSAQYQKELDPDLLKTIAKSIVAIKYTSKVMENSTYSIPCLSEYGDDCDQPKIDRNYNTQPDNNSIFNTNNNNINTTNSNESNRQKDDNLFRLKLSEVEQEELNQIEVRKKKSSSISDKAARISFQPKGIHYSHHVNNHVNNRNSLTHTPTEGKPSSNGFITLATNNSENSMQVSGTRQKGCSIQSPVSDKNNINLDNLKGQESRSSINSSSQIPSNNQINQKPNQPQQQQQQSLPEIQQEIVEIQENIKQASENSSGSNSPKCSEDADMYQPFSHFFVLGCDKNDVKEFDKMGADRVLLPGKLLYSFSDRVNNQKTDPFDLVKKQVSEYAFPYGLEVKKIEGDIHQIQQIIIPPTKHGMYDRFFFFKMRSQENFKQVQVEKQKNDLLRMVNPNKVLFFTCLQIRDYIEIANEDDPTKKSHWRVQKVFCFVSYFPFYELFSRLLQMIQDTIKVERQFMMHSVNSENMLSEIDSDSVQRLISTNIVQYLRQWQRTELRTLGKEYKFSMDQQGSFLYNIPSHQSFRQKILNWSTIGPISALSFSNFLFILFAILQEQHVIFVSTSLCFLTKAIACFEALLMPFQWPYPIVYTLPENLQGLLGSPQPIILGINRSGRYILSQDLVEGNPDHIFVLLDEDYDKIKNIMLQNSAEEDKHFINNFCSLGSQIFLYFCEDFYNLMEDDGNKDNSN